MRTPLEVSVCVCVTAVPLPPSRRRPADAKHYASQMLGQKLITKQTGEAGLPCDKVH